MSRAANAIKQRVRPNQVPPKNGWVGHLHGAGQGRRLDRQVIAPICGSELIVVDDIGRLPAGQDASKPLYRVVDAAHERRSVAVTSGLHPSGFDTIMPKALATATVDRFMHHVHVVLTEGGSLRLAEALAGKGVVPIA